MVSTGRIFMILMWKKLVVRLSSWYLSFPLEIVVPSINFLFLFLLRTTMVQLSTLGSERSGSKIQQNEPFSLDSSSGSPMLIMYTPDSPLSNTLMEEVGLRLNLVRLSVFDHNARGYYAFPKGTLDLHDNFIKNMKESTALVIFNDLDKEVTWPKHLNYTIRIKTDFMTHVYHSLDDDVSSHSRFGEIYEPFMRLQWAIDSSYLKLITGNELKQTITLQEFPYADTRERKEASVICTLIDTACFLSLMLVFIFVVKSQISDRVSGVYELIKMAGVSKSLYGLADFANLIPMGFWFTLSGSLLLTASSTALLVHTSPAVLFIVLPLYYVSIVSMGFAVCYLVRSVEYATVMAVLFYMVTSLPESLLKGYYDTLPKMLVVLLCILPHVPIHRFWEEVAALETYGKGLTLLNMGVTQHRVSALVCCVFLVAQSCVWFALAWYLGIVRPGPHGVARPWNFCFQRKKKQISPDELMDEETEPMARDSRYFEPPPARAQPGVSIVNVSMLYGKNRALSNVSFDVYRGEITVLLGHNGAGKTTLMSIITGMFSPTSGSVYVNGEDVAARASAGDGRVSFCPQKTVLIPVLTVEDHAVFFGLLSGKSMDRAKKSAKKILAQVGLEDKASVVTSVLSGGMLRRVQLVCALAGGADVLILDEPTSGLDVETRRELWDLLLSLRGSRTVVLSTHFMEEADALGDRVAALHAGQLRCHATPMFLKKSIGTGYRLSLTTVGLPKEPAITSLVSTIVPDAVLKEQSFNFVSYALPAQHSNKFPQLFSELESRRPELGVDSIGVGVSTLEEVFLKLCSDTPATRPEDLTDGRSEEQLEPHKRITGVRLIYRQFRVLIKRQMLYLMNSKITFLILQVALPLFILISMSYSWNSSMETEQKANVPIAMNLNIYSGIPDKRVLYNIDKGQADALRTVAARYDKTQFTHAPDIAGAVLRASLEDTQQLNKYLIGIELNDTEVKVMYTTVVRHAAPVAMNLLSNIVAAQLIPWADGATITATNAPLHSAPLSASAPLAQSKSFIECAMWAGIMILVILSTTSHVMSLLKSERKRGTRHLHVMAGCHPMVHFFATLLSQSLLYTIVIAIPAVLVALFDKQQTLTQLDFMGVFFIICVLGIVAYITFCYLFSFTGLGSVFLFIYIIVFGMVSGLMKAEAELLQQPLGAWGAPLAALAVLSPAHAFVAAGAGAAHAASLNAMCNLNRDNPAFCPMVIKMGKVPSGAAMFGADIFDVHKCCVERINVVPYFAFSRFAAGKDVVVMLIQIVVMMVLIALASGGALSWLGARITRGCHKPPVQPANDEMVRAENTYVNKAITLPPKQIPDAMLLHDVHKNFYRFLHPRKPSAVVKGVSFSVKKGECFGILGLNGAGKTTTFKVITGQYYPTQGNIFSCGYFFNKPRNKYLQSLSYCPQFFGLDEFLTGRQSLELLLTLRGFDADTVRREADTWIEVVGLQRYAGTRVSGYSGGMARRAAAACALCVGARAALLDEPTSGVDVGARRRVWAALRRAAAGGQAVVITSHSMDEMEAMCSRIAILSGGRVAALGSAAALRAAHAQGHAVVIKLRAPASAIDETDSANKLTNLKSNLQEKFNCSLKDEHKTMLHYHINETLRYSDLFTALEELKKTFPTFIEDYSVTETTLEEVFLSFAQQQNEGQVPTQV